MLVEQLLYVNEVGRSIICEGSGLRMVGKERKAADIRRVPGYKLRVAVFATDIGVDGGFGYQERKERYRS